MKQLMESLNLVLISGTAVLNLVPTAAVVATAVAVLATWTKLRARS